MGLGTIATIATIAGAGMQVAGGMRSQQEAGVQSALARQQAAERAAETERLTTREVELERRDIKDVRERQKLMFLKSGVTLEGSPLLKLEETRQRGQENIEEIEKAGEARARGQIQEGRLVAEQAKSRGRQQLVSGLVGGASTLSRLA